MIGEINVLDIYRSEEKLGKDKKSIVFSVVIQNPEKTLTDEEALIVQNKIVAKLKDKSIELRS